MLPFLNGFTSWLLFLSLSVSIGSVLGRWLVLGDTVDIGGVELLRLRATAARLGRTAALSLLLALGLVLLRQFLEFHDPFEPWREEMRFLLLGTAWGTTWRFGVAGAVIAGAGFWVASRGRRAGWAVATVAALALGAFPAFTGHANASDLRPLTLASDTLHVWAAGGWVGGLALVLFLEWSWRRMRGGEPASLLPLLVPRFSRLAIASVTALVATGVFASWVYIDGLGALFGSRYGRVLLLKLALVAGVLVLGWVNWRRITPRLGEAEGRATMRASALGELALANLVLIVTAVLVRTSPPIP
jgi:putative copper export protein